MAERYRAMAALLGEARLIRVMLAVCAVAENVVNVLSPEVLTWQAAVPFVPDTVFVRAAGEDANCDA